MQATLYRFLRYCLDSSQARGRCQYCSTRLPDTTALLRQNPTFLGTLANRACPLPLYDR